VKLYYKILKLYYTKYLFICTYPTIIHWLLWICPDWSEFVL